MWVDLFCWTSYQILRLNLNTYTFFLLGTEVGRLHMIPWEKIVVLNDADVKKFGIDYIFYNILRKVKNTFYANENLQKKKT